MAIIRFYLLAISLLVAGACVAAQRPNIVLIVADDLGFSDLGCYGGEIATPNLDGLAQNGLRFTQCYNTARCWPTRTALMTGYYPQQTRSDPLRKPLPRWASLAPHWLKPAGYRCYISGKWHVNGCKRVNADGGFDRSYILEDHNRNFYPNRIIQDDKPLAPVQKGSNYYTSVAFTDHAIDCLREHAKTNADQPFFSCLTFTVPHFPLQAPAEAIALYRAAYTSGWECVRHARYTRQQALQLLPAGLSATEREVGPPYAFPEIPSALGPNEINRALPWETLSPEQRAFQAEKMAIHAAMVHIMDQQIGRLLAQLRAMKALDNTLILFLSDNGASAEMMIRGDGHNPAAPMGSGESYLCLGPGWSTVANTPFRRHKTWVHEGGIATPLIVHWPAGIQDRNALRTDLCHVIDILPTFLSVAGLTPATQPRPQAPALPGISLMPAFAKEQALGARELFFHHEGNRALRTDAYKLVSATRDRNVWELYDMRTDRAEQHNLATQDPDRVNAMAARWQALEARFEQDSREPH